MIKNLLRYFFLFLVCFSWVNRGLTQCSTSGYPGNFIVSTNTTLGGIHNVTDTFRVLAGVTITVPTQSSGCGYIEINAKVVEILGTINATGSGNPGGIGGTGGGCLYNGSGGCQGITSCPDKDDCKTLRVDGGLPGGSGSGLGAGIVGLVGGNADGRKMECNFVNDEGGRVGGAGGAGGGAGGGYGGAGAASGGGGSGSATSTCSENNCGSYNTGAGGSGGGSGANYGNVSTYTIEMGSGGGGSGGGGRGYGAAGAAGSGGAGGGYIKIVATSDLTVSGSLLANGDIGGTGATGGSAGRTPRCCDDFDSGCDEHTYTAAGGGGGGGGGGSGGGILLESQCGSMVITGPVETQGGNGGAGGPGGAASSWASQGGNGQAGGGGGGGRIKIFTNSCGANNISSTPDITGGTGQNSGTPGTYYTGANTVILTPGSISGNQTACSGTSPNTLSSATAATMGTCNTFIYQWQEALASTGPWTDIPGANSASYTPSGLSSTTYFRRLVSAGACIDSTNVVSITINPSPVAEAGFGNDTICTAGTVLLGGNPTTTGGTSPFTYSWLPALGLNSASIPNPIASVSTSTDYVLTVTGSNGCSGTDIVTVNYNALGPVAEAGGGGTNTLCSGGSIMLGGNPAVIGGNSPYSYAWLPATGLNNSGISNPIATITATISYTLAVIDSLGCQAIDSVVVTFNQDGPYSDAGFGSDSLCTGGNVVLGGIPTGTGGIPPYTYSWIPSLGLNDTAISNPLVTITSSTVYYVNVMDAGNCQSTDSVTLIYNPSGPFADAGFGADIICSGGTVLLGSNPTGTGGGSPYNYSWSPVSGLDSTTVSNPIATVSSDITYILTLTDSLGCQASDSVQISYDSNGPVAEAGGDSTNLLCSGGGILLGGNPSASSGNSPYTYSWSPSFGLNSNTIANPVALINSTITYTLSVFDSSGCQSADFVTITFNNSGPFAEAGFGSDSMCTGGSVLLGGFPTASGGSSPYSYTWMPAFGLDSITVENPIATVNNDTTYFLTIIDSAGCQNLDSIKIKYNPSGPTAEAGFTLDTLCAGPNGTVLLGGNPTGNGIQPISYNWLQPAGLSNPISSNPTATVSATVTYLVIVTDSSNCMNVDEVTVNSQPLISINPPMPITCSGQSTTITATGAETYSWMPGNLTGSSIVVAPGSTTTYTVNGTDSNSCIGSASITINVPSVINAIAGSTTTKCFSDSTGTATVIAVGGTTDYTYLWSNGQTSNVSTGLNSGTYSVTVSDANGCTDTVSVFVNEPPKMVLNADSIPLSCNEANDAQAIISVLSGGNPPYSYLWSDGQTTPNATGLDSGTYFVTVSDFIPCIDSISIYVGVLPPMQPSVTVDSCHGWYKDGLASVDTVANANYPLTYVWLSGGVTVSLASVASGLDTGTYKVIFTDSIGCRDSLLVGVGINAVKANFSASPMVGTPPLEVSFTDSSKGNIFSYSWTFGNNYGSSSVAAPVFVFQDSGTYIVLLVVSDDGICWDTLSQKIEIERWVIPDIFSPNGDGKNDLFTVKNISIKSLEAKIFNRWGEKMYSWTDMANGFWDGRTEGGNEAPPGVYFYIISAVGLDGKEFPPKQGNITLVR